MYMNIIRLSYINFYTVRTILLNVSPILVKAQPMWKKWLRHGNLQGNRQYESTSNVSMCIQLYTLFLALIYIQKYITCYSYVDIITHILGVNIFNVCIRFKRLNATYLILNLYCTTLNFYRAIGKTPRYHKWFIIWCLIIYSFCLVLM